MKKIVFVSTALLFVFICFAHEYILLAAKYRLNRGEELEMHLFVADGFNIELERPYQQAPTKSFELITTGKIINLTGTEQWALPIIRRTVDFEGGGLIHLERNYARISLATDKFMDYLKEDHIAGIADKVDKTKKEQKERYTRYIKSLVQSGTSYQDSIYRTVIGQDLEIILLQNPYQLKPGATLKARIIFNGKPLANKTLTARNRTGNKASIAVLATTNQNGECAFKLQREGEWFIHVTHMIECPDKADSDWESFWATYSFEISK